MGRADNPEGAWQKAQRYRAGARQRVDALFLSGSWLTCLDSLPTEGSVGKEALDVMDVRDYYELCVNTAPSERKLL